MKKILVIDDEEWLREMVQLALTQKGYEVVDATTARAQLMWRVKNCSILTLCDVYGGCRWIL